MLPSRSVALLGVCVLGVFGLNFWGYSLFNHHYADIWFFDGDAPEFLGRPCIERGFEFLLHNRGFYCLLFTFLRDLPQQIEEKIALLNILFLSLQLINTVLLALIFRRLIGSVYFVPFVVLYALYPFAAAAHFYSSIILYSVASALFLASFGLFLSVQFDTGKIFRNVIFRIIPSLILFWLSLNTVEFAIFMSPLYLYIAVFGSRGKQPSFRISTWFTPYLVFAAVFLFMSIASTLLFFNSQSLRQSIIADALAKQAGLNVAFVSVVTAIGNTVMTSGYYLFANTIGLLVYPMRMVMQDREFLMAIPMFAIISLIVIAVLCATCWRMITSEDVAWEDGTWGVDKIRFLLRLGVLWAICGYLPFVLADRYSTNTGPATDRVNTFGSIGVVLSIGSLLFMRLTRAFRGKRFGLKSFMFVSVVVSALFLINLQVQKAMYFDAEAKERALSGAVLDESTRRAGQGRIPVFVFRRLSEFAFITPRAKLLLALSEPLSATMVAKVGDAVLGKFFFSDFAQFQTTMYGISNFLDPYYFKLYAEQRRQARPVTYRMKYGMQISDKLDSFSIKAGEGESVLSYAKQQYDLIFVELSDSSYTLGAPLSFTFREQDFNTD